MKENYYNCIYMYINKINNHKYIGQAKNFYKRHREHIRKSSNKYPIDKAFNKYGKENFEIVILKENLQTQCLLNFWESYYIDKYNCLSNENYNIASGGSNGNNFSGKTEEEMIEIRNKMSKSHIGKHDGELNPMYGKYGEENPMYGKHHSEETKQKIGNANKGKEGYWKTHEITQEVRDKISKTRKEKGVAKGENNPNYGKGKKVAQYDLNGNLIKIWINAKQAGEELHINYANIRSCCKYYNNQEEYIQKFKRTAKSCGGFIWKYFEEVK